MCRSVRMRASERVPNLYSQIFHSLVTCIVCSKPPSYFLRCFNAPPLLKLTSKCSAKSFTQNKIDDSGNKVKGSASTSYINGGNNNNNCCPISCYEFRTKLLLVDQTNNSLGHRLKAETNNQHPCLFLYSCLCLCLCL